MLRSHTDSEPVVVGLFSSAIDARHALNALREQHFSPDEVVAAFREPSSPRVEAEDTSRPPRSSDQWFGQLRRLYRGEDGVENARLARPARVDPQDAPSDFESMLTRFDLSAKDRMDAIVTVKAGARTPEARVLLEQRGARIAHARDSEQPGDSAADPVVASAPFTAPQQAAPGHVQLFGEVLRVRKEKVSSGEVHVRKESVTHMETVQVPVTREQLVVEHSDGSGPTDEQQSIRVPLSEERLHIDKDTVLREEYKVGKREVTHNESVSDNVRRERILIDDADTKASE